MSTNTSKTKTVTRLRALIQGTQKHSPNGNLTFGGATYAATALVQLLQKLIDAFAAVDAAKASSKVALTAQTGARTEVQPVALAYEQYLRALYGNAPDTLLDYGIAPRKKAAPLTTEQLAARKAKAEATREARGTKGPKAKKAIKGTVPEAATSPVPVAPQAAPAKTTA